MSAFWSTYVTLLTFATLAALVWLILAAREGQSEDLTERTTGHSYDGIEEYDNPLPRWWFWLFVATLVFAVGYVLLYPGMGNWPGLLPGYQYLDEKTHTPFADHRSGWSATHEWEREMARADQQYGPLYAKYAALPVAEVAKDEQALQMGGRLFANECSVCHGSDAKGAFGFPNLTDDDWLYGGQPETIETTITHGRQGAMPAWGAVLGEAGVKNVAGYVRSLSGLSNPEGIDLAAGQKAFQTTCVACHGAEGKGTPAMGAPNLTDRAWLYGSSFEQVAQSIRAGRSGRMPAQGERLGKDKVHILAAYVYSLTHPAEAQEP
jgi:cytochrome c oxidase cbb3-type subunit 3